MVCALQLQLTEYFGKLADGIYAVHIYVDTNHTALPVEALSKETSQKSGEGTR
jgi:hypothetical protein